MIRFTLWTTLLLLPSIFGRSPFISLWKPYLQNHLQLQELWISALYSLGTLLASFCVPYLISKKQSSWNRDLSRTYFLFAGCFVGLLVLNNFGLPHLLSGFVLLLIFIGVRLCGQGGLPLFIRAYVGNTQSANSCSWLSSFHNTFLVVVAGLISYMLADNLEWNWVWTIQCFILLALGFFIAFGFDKKYLTSTHNKKFNWSLKQFPKAFRLGLLMVAFHNFNATAMAFHVSDFANELDLAHCVVFKVFLPISLLEVIGNPLIAYLCNRFQVKSILCGLNGCIGLLCLSTLYLNTQLGFLGFVVACAMGWSCNHILSYVLPRVYLPQEQLTVGYATLISWSCLCSALGPYGYSLLANLCGGFIRVSQIILWVNILIFVCFLKSCNARK